MPIVDIIDNNYLINKFSVSSVPSASSNKIADGNFDSTSDSSSDSASNSSSNSSSNSNNKYIFFDDNFNFIKSKNNNLKSKKNIRKLFKI